MQTRTGWGFKVPVLQGSQHFILTNAWALLASIGLILIIVTVGEGTPPAAQVQDA